MQPGGGFQVSDRTIDETFSTQLLCNTAGPHLRLGLVERSEQRWYMCPVILTTMQAKTVIISKVQHGATCSISGGLLLPELQASLLGAVRFRVYQEPEALLNIKSGEVPSASAACW